MQPSKPGVGGWTASARPCLVRGLEGLTGNVMILLWNVLDMWDTLLMNSIFIIGFIYVLYPNGMSLRQPEILRHSDLVKMLKTIREGIYWMTFGL